MSARVPGTEETTVAELAANLRAPLNLVPSADLIAELKRRRDLRRRGLCDCCARDVLQCALSPCARPPR